MAAKKTRRKTSPKAQETLKRVMEEFKEGELESGKTGKKVKSKKQAVAIGLSEARKKGAKVAPKPKRKKATKKKTAKKTVKRKTVKRKTAKKAVKRTAKRRTVKRAKKA